MIVNLVLVLGIHLPLIVHAIVLEEDTERMDGKWFGKEEGYRWSQKVKNGHGGDRTLDRCVISTTL